MNEKEIDITLRGLNLHIDIAIQKVCETSNASSSNTRSMMYVLVVVSILSIVAVLNTHKWNWTESRIKRGEAAIVKLDSQLHSKNIKTADSFVIAEQLELSRTNVEQLRRNQIENFQTVKVPILGNAFDVNNLTIVAGITFLVLIYILKFTMYREITNLRIALNSISERYPADSDTQIFQPFYNYVRSLNPGIPLNDADILAKINYTRRLYHYNFLSMNEIFNLPPVKYSITNKLIVNKFILMNIFYFPTVTYAGLVINDMVTINKGLQYTPFLTIFTLLFGVFFLWRIGRHSKLITAQKHELLNYYVNFKETGCYHD